MPYCTQERAAHPRLTPAGSSTSDEPGPPSAWTIGAVAPPPPPAPLAAPLAADQLPASEDRFAGWEAEGQLSACWGSSRGSSFSSGSAGHPYQPPCWPPGASRPCSAGGATPSGGSYTSGVGAASRIARPASALLAPGGGYLQYTVWGQPIVEEHASGNQAGGADENAAARVASRAASYCCGSASRQGSIAPTRPPSPGLQSTSVWMCGAGDAAAPQLAAAPAQQVDGWARVSYPPLHCPPAATADAPEAEDSEEHSSLTDEPSAPPLYNEPWAEDCRQEGSSSGSPAGNTAHSTGAPATWGAAAAAAADGLHGDSRSAPSATGFLLVPVSGTASPARQVSEETGRYQALLGTLAARRREAAAARASGACFAATHQQPPGQQEQHQPQGLRSERRRQDQHQERQAWSAHAPAQPAAGLATPVAARSTCSPLSSLLTSHQAVPPRRRAAEAAVDQWGGLPGPACSPRWTGMQTFLGNIRKQAEVQPPKPLLPGGFWAQPLTSEDEAAAEAAAEAADRDACGRCSDSVERWGGAAVAPGSPAASAAPPTLPASPPRSSPPLVLPRSLAAAPPSPASAASTASPPPASATRRLASLFRRKPASCSSGSPPAPPAYSVLPPRLAAAFSPLGE